MIPGPGILIPYPTNKIINEKGQIPSKIVMSAAPLSAKRCTRHYEQYTPGTKI